VTHSPLALLPGHQRPIASGVTVPIGSGDAPFSHLASHLNNGQTPSRIEKREKIFNIGEEDRHLYFLVSGYVKTVTVSTFGRCCLMEIYAPGELIGTSCLVAPVRTETATAMTRAVMYKISKGTFLSMLGDTDLVGECLRYLASLLVEREQWIAHLTTVDSERRLAAVLLHLSSKLGTRIGQMTHFECQITHQEIADMVGTTRSRIGYFLDRFRAQGLVGPKSKGRLIVIEHAIRDYLMSPGSAVT
jgi:CRP/FNR family transcriptional regulator, cyclic AMP receptor protein